MDNNLILFKKYRNFFMVYGCLNPMQEKLMQVDMMTSLVLSAPTGAGKTFAFDMALVHLMQQKLANKNVKAVYIAPTKTLCSERYADWTRRFAGEKYLNSVRCELVTGDSSKCYNDLGELNNVDVIVTTPEKWEILTHQWLDHKNILGSIELFMIDEVLILDERERGSIMEVIVSRMKTIARHSNSEIRFVLASATVPNISDITTWIQSGGYKAEENVFGEIYRSVPLETHLVGIKYNGMDKNFNEKIREFIREYAYDKSTLVFCNTIQDTEKTAKRIFDKDNNNFLKDNQSDKNVLTLIAQSLHNETLKEVLPNRVAFHHKGLTLREREIVEENFRNQKIRVLFCTSTLAYGVNLPAHLVMLKDTKWHFKSEEYPGHLIKQMIGRAGRKQYEKERGVAIILTTKKHLYINDTINVNGIASQFFDEDILCLEIVLQIFNNRATLKDWLETTFLYTHARRNHGIYKLSGFNVEDQLLERFEKTLSELCNENLFLTRTGDNWQGTPYGLLKAKYCLHLATMRNLVKFKNDATLFDVLQLITRSVEFNDYKLKKNEKKALNIIKGKGKKSVIRFPINKNIATTDEKVSCLLQASLGNHQIAYNFEEVTGKIRMTALRITRCLFEILLLGFQSNVLSPSPNICSSSPIVQEISHSYKTLLAVVTMAKCLHANRWEKSEYVEYQLSNVDEYGKSIVQALLQTDERNIELGEIKQEPLSQQLPVYNLKMTLSNDSTQMDEKSVEVLLVAKQTNEAYTDKRSTVILIVGCEKENNIFYYKKICNEQLSFKPLEVYFTILRSSVEHIKAHLIHSTLNDFDCEATLFKEDVPKIMMTPNNKRKLNDSTYSKSRKKNKLVGKLDPKQPKMSIFFKAKKRIENYPDWEPSTSQTNVSAVQSELPLQSKISEENLLMTQDFLKDDSIIKENNPTSFVGEEDLQTENVAKPSNEGFNLCHDVIKSYLEKTNQIFDYDTFRKVFDDKYFNNRTSANNCPEIPAVRGTSTKKSINMPETPLSPLTQNPSKYRLILSDPKMNAEPQATKTSDEEEVVRINSNIMSAIIEEKNLGAIPSECEIVASISSNESQEQLTFEEILHQKNLL